MSREGRQKLGWHRSPVRRHSIQSYILTGYRFSRGNLLAGGVNFHLLICDTDFRTIVYIFHTTIASCGCVWVGGLHIKVCVSVSVSDTDFRTCSMSGVFSGYSSLLSPLVGKGPFTCPFKLLIHIITADG